MMHKEIRFWEDKEVDKVNELSERYEDGTRWIKMTRNQ